MSHHGGSLRALTKDDALVAALKNDYQKADLSKSDRAMLDYAHKLTTALDKVEKADIDNLRTLGFEDQSLHDIVAIAAYFNFVNRLVDGLGVEIEPDCC